jgi:hypothetical protein
MDGKMDNWSLALRVRLLVGLTAAIVLFRRRMLK